MEKVLLKALVRDSFGKGGAKHLREEGQIPAVIYKGGKEGVNIQVDSKELWKALHTEAGSNAIITMDISGGEKDAKKTVIVQEVQLDPLSDKFLHVDFHEISLKEKIKVKVPIVVKGEAVGVKEEEGVLSQTIWDIEVECLPTAIPEHIDINVEELRMNEGIHVKDIIFPEGVIVVGDPEQVVVSVVPPKAEEAPEEEAVEVAEGEEPEIIKKGKAEDEEAAEEKSAGGEEPAGE